MGTGKGHVHIGTRNSGLWLGFGLGLSARVVEMRGVVARGGGRAVMIGSFCDGPFRGGGPGTTCNDGGCSKSFSRDAIRVHIQTGAIIVRNIHIYVVVVFFFLGDILCVSKSPFLVFTGLFGGRNRRWKNDRGRWHGQGWYGCRQSQLNDFASFTLGTFCMCSFCKFTNQTNLIIIKTHPSNGYT